SYGSLLGTTLFQSFLAGPLAYKALSRPQFATLQTKTFPYYFGLQSVLPVLLCLTYPGAKHLSARLHSLGVYGVLAEENRWSVLVPLGVMFGAGVLNWAVVGPWTTKVMKERKHQETRDGKKYTDEGPHSQDMQRLNKSFAALHGASTLINLTGLGAMIWYGFTLGSMM
ncbi:hypothetical protein K402DRAFT_334990, partial [Aulographum hederae CBS 113979]